MQSICLVEGVRAAGVREGKYGVALIEASGTAAAVFTKNQVFAEPVRLMRERMAGGALDGIVVNAGNANVFTGVQGYGDACRMAEAAAAVLGTVPERIGVASTGVIGRYMPIELVTSQIAEAGGMLRSEDTAETDAARAIMTTDLVEKHAAVVRNGFTVAGITKGSGMIAPNMGTMLAFIYTDAEVPAPILQKVLQTAVVRSFNRVVVDGDTSTNDCVFCTATGRRGTPDMNEFQEALEEVCVSLARQIAADGEGATRLIEVRVTGAPTEEDAAKVARTVVGSPLVKTAVYGKDPNWGRVIAAAGRAGVDFDPDQATVAVTDGTRRVLLANKGEICADDVMHPEALVDAASLMDGAEVIFEVALGAGSAAATAWGCDLTEQYVEINGKYTT
ncbi:bifunctional glutamate N-acetyltransferase/amino-acid acetyltransferase ArgJ [Methanogenium organophilum]|uniref:Glutamate N-acetyltransferase n=1 Tax=Methanogenium organophilum TaxID=2199 RepID=A0A9X9S6Q1_METOG|nr:bifunctional glutamate N-acetyltransferase/amino-acid acetyltransferase ArgJ [Methanogenium organophilum]WAI02413.1 bifunctional glutamate N-acetyltransferase/amino-acid acetyltransferase ArgJ [Methanogenium organophilum]